jgi:hypothetical protein
LTGVGGDLYIAPRMTELYFRDAQPRDAAAVAPLLHESSRRLLDHVFGHGDPLPFLRRDFRRGVGIFGWRHLVLAVASGEVICTQTYYPGGMYPRLLRASLASGLMHFGPVGLARLGWRSRALDAMFVPPREDGLFMANGCVAAPWRGRGVFTALIARASASSSSTCPSRTRRRSASSSASAS